MVSRTIGVMTGASIYDPAIRQAALAAQALPRWRRGWAVMRLCRASILRNGLHVLAISVAISVVLWLLRGKMSFLSQLAYSTPIAVISWLLIDSGRFYIDQDSPHFFPRGWRAVAFIGTGVLLGFIGGTLIGDAFNQRSSFELLRRSPEFFTFTFLFSMAAGGLFSLYFYSRGQSAFHAAEMQAKSRQATEAQLKLLQSQLDPHMLFNTLANLRALIPNEPDRAIQMLDQLGDFLRATLSASRAQEHCLELEFDRLRDYLALMQVRLGSRLRYELSLPDNLAHINVPTLILQSLVENAIVHGLEPKVGGGQIWIGALEEAGQIVLQVADDGLGLPADAPAFANQSGFGLSQVRERLRSRYGDQATVELAALAQKHRHVSGLTNEGSELAQSQAALTPGCQVTLRLPISA